MVALHILGNGFDRKHELPTSYSPHLREIAIRSERFTGEWDCYSEAGELWSDVEEYLAFPNTDGLIEHLECYAPDMLSERESDRDGIIHEAEQLLSFPLEEFARRADEAVEQARPFAVFQKMFDPGDFFLTFNYTHTLERLYLIDSARILHLHGEVGGEPLILGTPQEPFGSYENCANGTRRRTSITTDRQRTTRLNNAYSILRRSTRQISWPAFFKSFEARSMK